MKIVKKSSTMAGGRGKLRPEDNPKPFTSTNQPANSGRKKDPFRQALEDLAETDGRMPVPQTELAGLLDVKEGPDGMPVLTVRGEWAIGADGEPDKRLALIVVQLPDAHSIVAQWVRDSKGKNPTLRARSRETLFDRVMGKPTQPLANDPENPLGIGVSQKDIQEELAKFKSLMDEAAK